LRPREIHGSFEVELSRTPHKTSIDILHERDALLARVEELEKAMAAIGHEADHSLRFPQIAFLATCRMGALARGALGPGIRKAEPRDRDWSGIDVSSPARSCR
jgi:hypothetical protein